MWIMKRTYFTPLPYLPAYDRMIRHRAGCALCTAALAPNTGSGQYEDLCAAGRRLDDALRSVVEETKQKSRWN